MATKFKKPRYYVGSLPEAGFWDMWEEVSDPTSKSLWKVYILIDDEDKKTQWTSFRVISSSPVPNKANFALAWNKSQKRLAGRDSLLLREHMPVLYAKFLKIADIDPVYVGPLGEDS